MLQMSLPRHEFTTGSENDRALRFGFCSEIKVPCYGDVCVRVRERGTEREKNRERVRERVRSRSRESIPNRT